MEYCYSGMESLLYGIEIVTFIINSLEKFFSMYQCYKNHETALPYSYTDCIACLHSILLS